MKEGHDEKNKERKEEEGAEVLPLGAGLRFWES
jgi:hypothetical protein